MAVRGVCDTRAIDMTEPIQVVIDTNVLVSAFRSKKGASNRLLDAVGDPRWKINISAALVLEYEEALKRVLREQGKPLALADEALDGLLVLATRRSVPARYRPMSLDADDDFIIDLAIESCATYLVTFNIRDFLSVRRYGISIVRPGEFLRIVEGLP